MAGKPAGSEERFPWGEIRWLSSGTLAEGAELTFGVVTIDGGQRNARHYHPNCEEVLYVLAGECRHSLGEAWHHLRPGQALRIPRGVLHHAVALGEAPLRCVIAYSSGDRQTVVVE